VTPLIEWYGVLGRSSSGRNQWSKRTKLLRTGGRDGCLRALWVSFTQPRKISLNESAARDRLRIPKGGRPQKDQLLSVEERLRSPKRWRQKNVGGTRKKGLSDLAENGGMPSSENSVVGGRARCGRRHQCRASRREKDSCSSWNSCLGGDDLCSFMGERGGSSSCRWCSEKKKSVGTVRKEKDRPGVERRNC